MVTESKSHGLIKISIQQETEKHKMIAEMVTGIDSKEDKMI